MSDRSRQSERQASWKVTDYREDEERDKDDVDGPRFEESKIERLLQGYEQECEQLRVLYTHENDRLRRKLAAANKQLSSAFDLLQVLSTLIGQLSVNPQKTKNCLSFSGISSAKQESSILEDSNFDVTQ